MRKEPIDYNNPLGISKREWTLVLGVNLALLLLVYVIALVCTLCGSTLFLLNFESAELQRVEDTLRGWNMFAFVQIGLSTIEATLVGCYIAKARPKWWVALSYFAICLLVDLVFMFTTGYAIAWVSNAIMFAFWAFSLFALNGFKPTEKWWVYLCRFAISLVVTFTLNEGIGLFRTLYFGMWKTGYPNSVRFALNVEYYLALALTLGFLTLVIPWQKKGGNEQCPIGPNVSGSSPTTTNSSQNNSKSAKTNLPPQYRKRLLRLKIKVITIQTAALVVTIALPWFGGKPIEFALVYASFCLTRIMLGFNRSLHFKSELCCITIGVLTFWGLTFLAPSAEASIILSLVYGAATALGFRLYWELHDLMMYKRASKTDRYAMLYVVFRGNLDPRHINGVMRAKGYADKETISMVQAYMDHVKVDAIAFEMNYSKRTIEDRLTELATSLYESR